MKTYIYLVRHAESPKTDPDERNRGLTDKGWADAGEVTALLRDEGIDVFVSSPYKRAVLTIEELAKVCEKDIVVYEELRETVFSDLIQSDKELYAAIKKMFDDPEFSLPGGETSARCTARAVRTLNTVIKDNPGRKIAIGTHGMIMTLMLRHFDRKYDYEFLINMTRPDVYKLEFDNGQLVGIGRMWETAPI